MKALDRLRFSTKIGLGTSMIVLLAAVLLALTFSTLSTRVLINENKKHGLVLAENLALRALDPMFSADFLQMKDLVDGVRDVDENVDYAFILDRDGNVLAHTFSRGMPVGLVGANVLPRSQENATVLIDTGRSFVYDFAVPVVVAENRLGTVRVGLSRSKIQGVINELLHPVMGVSLATLLVAVFLGSLFANKITSRINELRRHAEALVTGKLSGSSGPKLTRNCWEVRNCSMTACPAYGDSERRCWYLAGTLGDEDSGSGEACFDCQVYRENAGDEIQDLAETFDYLVHTLQIHLGELHEAERTMARQQQLLRTVLDSTPDWVTLQAEDTSFLAVNRAFADALGLRPESLVGRKEAEFLEPSEVHISAEKLARVFSSGRGAKEEVRLRRDGRTIWLHVIRVPVRGHDGKVNAVLKTARDVTEIKNYQAQLIQAQKMESLGKLAGGVAHEINTPLGIILGYAQLMKEDAEDETMREELAIVEKQAKVCRKIVADLLGFSRQSVSEKQEMCFNNSIMEAVTLVRHTFEMEQVRIVTVLDERMPIIYGDPEKLKQIWINLLNNARDAMPEGGIIRVATSLNTAARNVTAYFSDTGPGIDSEHLKKVFDPFFSTKGVGQGTGLGLSVSFGIVEDHGGNITVVSPVPDEYRPETDKGVPAGPGALFTVDLPLDNS